MDKYLQHYAEPEVGALDGLPAVPCWENVLVIPACNENAGFLRPLPPCAGRSLMVLVINETAGAAREVSLNNRRLAEAVQAGFEPAWQSAPEYGLSLWRDPASPRDLLLADRFNEGRQLPAGGGVGLARKTGVDLALALVRRQRIRSRWIHCSDADVRLPATYFSCISGAAVDAADYSALVYPYSHVGDGAEDSDVFSATQRYELSLRYYVAGLKFAGSPYAFHTIGSTMAVSASAYAKVRGFPRREAGEDFYLLNKLAKVGPVLELEAGPGCSAIEIESRCSDRVPFGTGAAVNRITAMHDPEAGYLYYNPAVFVLLRTWLQSLPAIWRSGRADPGEALRGQGGDRQPALLAALGELNTQKALEHAFRQSGDLDQFKRQVHTWFDAFRTLKLIHALRGACLPSISRAELQAHPVFRSLLASDRQLAAFYRRFESAPARRYFNG
jgi:hypothetical protein